MIDRIRQGIMTVVDRLGSLLKPILGRLQTALAPPLARVTQRCEPLLARLRPLLARIERKHLVVAAWLFGILMVALFVPGGVMDRTSTPAFCGSCHTMDKQYEHWFMTGLHRTVSCTDCHLPHTGPLRYYTWKAIDGTKDVVFFYGRLYSDDTRITSHGASVVQENCLRCHEHMVSRITTDGRTCWSCHRRVSHSVVPVSMTSK